MITILRTSFVGPAAARLAFVLAACAGVVLLTPAPASDPLDISSGAGVIDCHSPADSARDREWRSDVGISMSDSCDDDDDQDDEASTASGQLAAGGPYLERDFSSGVDLVDVTDRRGSRERDAHLLRGPPPSSRESFCTADDDTTDIRYSASRRVNNRDPRLPFLCDPFDSTSARSDDRLRAPP